METGSWSSMTYAEKNRQLYFQQKQLLDEFLEKGAISRAQHDKSLLDLTEKMGMAGEESREPGCKP